MAGNTSQRMEAVANWECEETETWQCLVESKELSLDLTSLCDINMKQHAEQVQGCFFFSVFQQDLAKGDTKSRWYNGHNATVDRNWISSLTD